MSISYTTVNILLYVLDAGLNSHLLADSSGHALRL